MSVLSDALSRIEAVALAPFGDRLGKPVDVDAELGTLRRIVSTLLAGGKRQERPSTETLAVARARWSECGGDLRSLTARQVRSLCSDVEVATSSAFATAMERHGELSQHRRWLEGLIVCYFANWRPAGAETLESVLSGAVKMFQRRSARVTQLRPVASQLFSPKAATWLGALVVHEGKPWESVLDEWQVERSGRLGREAANASVELWLSWFGSVRQSWTASEARAEVEFLLQTVLAPVIVTQQQFSKAISEIILWPEIEKHEGLVDDLREFALSDQRLGDPRHRPQNWSACNPEALRKARAWFARFDLEFFFNHIIHKDPHRRKAFWLQYIDKVEDSNVALCVEDVLRVRARAGEELRYSRATGSGNVSAFLMRFPGSSAVCVEFSQPGNALYCHDATLFDKYVGGIRRHSLRLNEDLKNKEAVRQRIVHRDRWQFEVRNMLAGMGIRPQ